MEKSIISIVKEYIKTCPLLVGSKINVDYLSEKVKSYSIEPIPADVIVKKYITGRELRQFVFVFASQEIYSQDVLDNIMNSKFYEDFYNWIYKQNKNKEFPNLEELEGIRKVKSIECITPGYAFQISETSARYQIQLKIEYEYEL